MSITINRRQILAGMAMSGLTGLSGCTLVSSTLTELAGVQVLNPYTGTERVDIRIEQSDSVVVNETLSVATEDGAETITCSWDRDGAAPRIEARIAADQTDGWQTLDLAQTSENTVLVQAIVRPEETVTFLVIGPDDEYFIDVCGQA